jgi:dTDP-4-amino-4,6-dideoxygalactose transaminase
MYEPLEKVIVLLESQGYTINDPWDVVKAFEDKVAKFAGSKYAVATDSCTNALFLCLKYLKAKGKIQIPKKTYLSVPQTVIHAGCEVDFVDKEWSGLYSLDPYPIVDSATRFNKGMYIQDTYQCLSFHYRKILAICKGGMILTNDKKAVEWFKLAEYEGRDRNVPHDEMPFQSAIDCEAIGPNTPAGEPPFLMGWNMYMPPEQAARGIWLFEDVIKGQTMGDSGGSQTYHDLTKYEIFNNLK